MVSKAKLYFGVVVLLTVFALAMLSGRVLKYPLTGSDDIVANLTQMENAVTNSDWSQAQQILPELESAWKQVRPRMYMGAEKDDLIKFDDTLATLKAAVVSRHEALALRDIALLGQVFSSLE
ncbi:MAG: DUF4363 family protein [bacterium]|jgi:hypothetical protein